MSPSPATAVAWLRQPTTIAGISGLVGTATAALSGSMTWQVAAPLVVGSLVAMILPDNSGAKTTIQTATADIITAEQAIVTKPGIPVSVVGKS